MTSVHAIPMCGPGLQRCRCRDSRHFPRSQAQLDALHREAVNQAVASGWATQPIPSWVVTVLVPDYRWWDEQRRAA
jgi:hypothetical protein